jgi:hypothetical protein
LATMTTGFNRRLCLSLAKEGLVCKELYDANLWLKTRENAAAAAAN